MDISEKWLAGKTVRIPEREIAGFKVINCNEPPGESLKDRVGDESIFSRKFARAVAFNWDVPPRVVKIKQGIGGNGKFAQECIWQKED